MTFERNTLASDALFEGFGLHSGAAARVEIRPGAEGFGFTYQGQRIAATPENVTDTTRCTRLGAISTIEHLMSAFAAMGVTDAEVELNAPELPALDGASEIYCRTIQQVGLHRLGDSVVSGPFARVFEKGPSSVVAIAKGSGHWRYVFDTGERWPGIQDFEIVLTPDSYVNEIASSRTFAFEEELERVRVAGLGQGLDETTALVLGDKSYVNPAKQPDEPARHKMLDLIGDLYLSGVPPFLLDVVAERSGHTANVRAAAKLLEAVSISPA